jgi:hypothetical protein
VLVSLVEQEGREAIVGQAYVEYVQQLQDPEIKFVEFDIHQGLTLNKNSFEMS